MCIISCYQSNNDSVIVPAQCSARLPSRKKTKYHANSRYDGDNNNSRVNRDGFGSSKVCWRKLMRIATENRHASLSQDCASAALESLYWRQKGKKRQSRKSDTEVIDKSKCTLNCGGDFEMQVIVVASHFRRGAKLPWMGYAS